MLSPDGTIRDTERRFEAVRESTLIRIAARGPRSLLRRDTFAVGVSITGEVDPWSHLSLFSGASSRLVWLEPLFDAAGDVPVILDSDLHALMMLWPFNQLTGDDACDVLLIGLDDDRRAARVVRIELSNGPRRQVAVDRSIELLVRGLGPASAEFLDDCVSEGGLI